MYCILYVKKLLQAAGVLQDQPGEECNRGERAANPRGGRSQPGSRHEEVRTQSHRQIFFQGMTKVCFMS